MRLLLSAFSCEPGRGSEPEVGYRTLLGAARHHEVWALVSATGLPALEAAIATHPARARIHLIPLPVGADESVLSLKDFHVRYARWQQSAGALARRLDDQLDFDLVHHVTLSASWTPVGVAGLRKPMVWGPLGGGVETPSSLRRTLGPRGLLEDVARSAARRVASHGPSNRRAARTARVVLAQNRMTADRLNCSAEVQVLTQGTAVHIATVPQGSRSPDVAFVGRLVPWKGTELAVRTLPYLQHPGARLRFYGSGPDEERIRQIARRLGVADRISFEGWLPRDVLLQRVATSGVVFHPSLHDEAGLAVAEALSLGTPVVCLDHGGPAQVVSHWDEASWRSVTPQTPTATARAFASAIDRFLADPPPVPSDPIRPSQDFADSLEEAYRFAVRAGTA